MAPRKIERKDTQFERQITYGKRSEGLLKKAFELSVLCDVDVALIMYAPNGRLRHFSNRKLERILQEYIQHQATIPEKNPGEVDNSDKPVISQDTIEKINMFAGKVDAADQQSLEANIEEINEETKKLILLQELQRKLIPDMGTSKSIHELEERKRFLGEALHKISQKKKTILSRFNIGACAYTSQHNLQRGEQLQQGYHKEIEAPFSTQPQQTCGINQIGVPPPVPEPIEISTDGWSVQHCGINQIGVPPPVPEPIEISNDGWSLQHCGKNQIGVPPPVPEPIEISNDGWSLQHCGINQIGVPPPVPEPIEISNDGLSLQHCGINQIGVPPPVPEPFEISNDRWSLQHIVDQNLPQKVPVPVQQIGTYLQSSEDLDRVLQMDWNEWLQLG